MTVSCFSMRMTRVGLPDRGMEHEQHSSTVQVEDSIYGGSAREYESGSMLDGDSFRAREKG
jgi:hypothetical protein